MAHVCDVQASGKLHIAQACKHQAQGRQGTFESRLASGNASDHQRLAQIGPELRALHDEGWQTQVFRQSVASMHTT